MLRLTTLLLAGLYLSLAVFGRDGGPKTIATATAAPAPASESLSVQDYAEALIRARATSTKVDNEPKMARIGRMDAPAGWATAPLPEADESVVTVSSKSVAPADEDYVYVTGNVVNMRAGPSTSDAVIGQLREGTRAIVIEASGNWTKIQDAATGETGFMSAKFLSATAPRS